MEKAKHGGNVYEIERNLGMKKGELIDFSANINPLGIPNSFKEKLIENIHIIKNYPDPEYKELKKSIAIHDKVDINKIIVGNGATEIIFSLIDIIKPQKSLLLAPTFAEYERALKKVGSKVSYFNLKEENEFEIDREILKYIDKDLDLIVICNPNNPTGKLIDKTLIEEILKTCKEKNIHIIMDEAFIDFIENYKEISLINYLDEYKNIHIIRALTKFYALPGLRLGYGIISNTYIKEKFENSSEPWSVNSYADLAGQIVLKDDKYIKKTRAWIKKEKHNLYEELTKISGIKAYKPSVNYILIKTKYKSLKEELLKYHILIRSCSNYNNLDDTYFRVAVKSDEDNKKLIKALKDIYHGS